jgi:putative oxygen-independent coproporphyrinogen III oxidase
VLDVTTIAGPASSYDRASAPALDAAPTAPASLRFAALPPLSLYVHLPWCIKKCPYCDFNSYESSGALAEHDYVAALIEDLTADLPLAQGRPLTTIFIGGGTPSLFSGAAIRTLLDGIRGGIPVDAEAEITLEANPGAADTSRFAAYRDAGVTRLSIGVQSLRDAQLAALGRVHRAEDAYAAVEHARRAGFTNINLDLMYGLPGDSVSGAIEDLEAAISLGPAHLSWYQLTLEPHTAFFRRPPPLPEEDMILEIERRGRELLTHRGLLRYEISAYARAGQRCRHNLQYWEFGDYLGIGAGAHGKVTLAQEGSILRRAKRRNPRTFMQLAGSAAVAADERIATPRAVTLEFLMNALRLTEGVSTESFTQRTGLAVEQIADALARARSSGWLVANPDRLRATPDGLQVLNRVLSIF